MAEKHRPLRLFTESDSKGSSLRQSEASDAIKVLEKSFFFFGANKLHFLTLATWA